MQVTSYRLRPNQLMRLLERLQEEASLYTVAIKDCAVYGLLWVKDSLWVRLCECPFNAPMQKFGLLRLSAVLLKNSRALLNRPITSVSAPDEAQDPVC